MSRELEDFEIRSKVRALLVKYWFDTADLSIGVHHGNVTVFGSLQESSNLGAGEGKKSSSEITSYEMDGLGDMKEIKTTKTTKTIEKENIMDSISKRLFLVETEISELSGVRSVNFEFHNYIQKGKNWVRT
ncbi:MAG: hypothetical protein JW774_10065 [Candidatus Aureabacteria bacterium]|nr:hypothetical protein [Candidatus Auribacterota bacterium]